MTAITTSPIATAEKTAESPTSQASPSTPPPLLKIPRSKSLLAAQRNYAIPRGSSSFEHALASQKTAEKVESLTAYMPSSSTTSQTK